MIAPALASERPGPVLQSDRLIVSRPVPSRLFQASGFRAVARVFLLGVFLGTTSVQAADSIRVAPLVRDGQVLVSFTLADGYSDDVREVIRSGLRSTFTYTIELRLAVPGWVDRVVDSAVVTNTVQFDNLTRRHTLSRAFDGRVDRADVVADEGAVRQWLTAFDRLPLFRTARLEANRDYYVVVRATARPRSTSLLPWGSTPTGSARFTFIP